MEREPTDAHGRNLSLSDRCALQDSFVAFLLSSKRIISSFGQRNIAEVALAMGEASQVLDD